MICDVSFCYVIFWECNLGNHNKNHTNRRSRNFIIIHIILANQSLLKDLRLDLRSWLPDIDQLRDGQNLSKAHGPIGPRALDQLCPSPRLIFGRQQCPKISLKFYYNTLRQTIQNRHRNEFNL